MANATQKLIKRLRCDHAMQCAINNKDHKTPLLVKEMQSTLTLVRQCKIGPGVSNFNS